MLYIYDPIRNLARFETAARFKAGQPVLKPVDPIPNSKRHLTRYETGQRILAALKRPEKNAASTWNDLLKGRIDRTIWWIYLSDKYPQWAEWVEPNEKIATRVQQFLINTCMTSQHRFISGRHSFESDQPGFKPGLPSFKSGQPGFKPGRPNFKSVSPVLNQVDPVLSQVSPVSNWPDFIHATVLDLMIHYSQHTSAQFYTRSARC